MALARTVAMSSNVSAELRRRAPPSLLHSDSLVVAPALARSELVVLYFIPLQSLIKVTKFSRKQIETIGRKMCYDLEKGDFAFPVYNLNY